MSAPQKPLLAPTWATDANFSSGPANGFPTKIAPPGWPTVAQGFLPATGIDAELVNEALWSLFSWVQHLKDIQALNWTCPLRAADLGTFIGRVLGANPKDALCFIGGIGLKLFFSLPGMEQFTAVTIPMGGSTWPFNFIGDNGSDKTLLIAENDGAGDWDTYLYTGGTLTLQSANSQANAIPACLAISATGRWLVGGNSTMPASAIWYSDNNGATWTQNLLPDAAAQQRPVYAIACKPGLIVALGSKGGGDICTAWTSSDNGINWAEHQDITAGEFLYVGEREARINYCAARDVFWTVGLKGHVYTSIDGVAWTARTQIALTNGSDGAWIANNGGGFIAAFKEATLGIGQANDHMVLVYSTDMGITWRPIGDAPFGPSETLKSMVPVPGGFGALSTYATSGTLSIGRSILL